jgi:2-(3-amino-3-carboxypropyl)histidine synthase
MTMAGSEDEATTKPSVTPKKRFIGKTRAEALRKKSSGQQPPNIENGQLTLKGTYIMGVSKQLGTTPRGGRIVNQIPREISEDSALNEAIKIVMSSPWPWLTQKLPQNYNFEIHKTVWHIRMAKCKRGSSSPFPSIPNYS